MLRHHACSLVGIEVCLILFDVWHVEASVCVGALVVRVVAVVAARVAIVEIIKSLEDVSM